MSKNKLTKRQTKHVVKRIIAELHTYCPPWAGGEAVGQFPPCLETENQMVRLIRNADDRCSWYSPTGCGVAVDGYVIRINLSPARQFTGNVEVLTPKQADVEIYSGFNPLRVPSWKRHW